MSVKLIPDPVHHVCDSCDAEHWGPLQDVVTMGWTRKKVTSGFFVMCSACAQHYGERWAAVKAA